MSESCAAAVSVSVESSTAGEHLEDEQGRCVNGSMDGAVCLEGEDAVSGGSPLCVATPSLRVVVELRLLSGDAEQCSLCILQLAFNTHDLDGTTGTSNTRN